MESEKDYNCIVKFDQNYNNKLSCEAFPTIRKTDNVKYVIGREYLIMLYDYHSQTFHEVGKAVLVAEHPFKPNDLTNTMSYMDAGMRKDTLMNLLISLYKDDIWNITINYFTMYTFHFSSKTPGW